jgi:hypothetical protein
VQPTIGRMVHYTLSGQDAQTINHRRADPHEFGHGNHAEEGQTYPATVVRVFDPSVTTSNLQVHLDGTDVYWATSRTEGDGPGFWAWPTRA